MGPSRGRGRAPHALPRLRRPLCRGAPACCSPACFAALVCLHAWRSKERHGSDLRVHDSHSPYAGCSGAVLAVQHISKLPAATGFALTGVAQGSRLRPAARARGGGHNGTAGPASVSSPAEAEACGVPRRYASDIVELAHRVRDLDPVTGLTHPLMLLRYLTYVQNVSGAVDLLRDAAAWREEIGLDAIMREWGVPDQDQQLPWRCCPQTARAALADLHFCGGRAVGRADGDRPLIVARVGRFDWAGVEREGLADLIKNHFVFTLEDLMQAGHSLSVARKELVLGLLVADIQGVSLSVLRHMDWIQELVRITNYYPDLVDKVIIINAPLVFRKIWQILSALLQPQTKRKFQILGYDFADHLEASSNLDKAMLPACLGGNGSDEGLPKCRPIPRGAGDGLDLSFGGQPVVGR